MNSSSEGARTPGKNFLLISAAVLCCLAYWALRLYGIEHYPAPHPDEGFWYLPAKHLAEGRDPLIDGRLHPLLAPLQFFVASQWFSVAPPSLFSARLLSACVGFLPLLVLLPLASNPRHRNQLLIATVLLTFSAPVILMQRIALLEAFQFSLLCGVLLAFAARYFFLSGVLLALAALVKINVLYIALPIVLTFWLCGRSELDLKNFLAGCIGFVLCAALGYGLLYSYFPQEFFKAFQYELDGKHFIDEHVLFHVARFGIHSERLPYALLQLAIGAPFLGLLSLAYVFRSRVREEPVTALCLTWVIVGFCFLSFQIFTVPRYFLTFYPPLIYLASRGISELARSKTWIAILITLVFCGYHTTRIVRGVQKKEYSQYDQLVANIRAQSCEGDSLLSASYLALSSPVPGYGFYRRLFAYPDDKKVSSIPKQILENDFSLLAIDPEMRSYLEEEELMRLYFIGRKVFQSKDYSLYRFRECPS